MKIISGISSLESLLEKIKIHLEVAQEDLHRSAIVRKVKLPFYEILLSKTFVFYVKNGAISSSYSDADFSEIVNEIVHVDDIESLVVLNDLDNISKKKYQISWIALEVFNENIQDKTLVENEIIKTQNYLKIVSFFDFYKKNEIDDNNKKVYKINFKKLEKQFEKDVTVPIRNLLHGGGKNLYKKLFNMQRFDENINEVKHIEQTLSPIAYSEIKITKSHLKYVYNYRCQICNTLHYVILSKSQRDKNTLQKKYTRVSSDFIKLNSTSKRYEVICDHEGTKYEKGKTYFSFLAKNLDISEVKTVNLDKVFLYAFFNYIHNENQILFRKEGTNMNIEIDAFIKQFGS